MANVWSFNTTVRNPERVESLLRMLSEMEGQLFDSIGQEKFFGLQIKKRYYKPNKSTLAEKDLIDAVYGDSGDELDDSIVDRILLKYKGSMDAAGRGRTSASVLNRFGLCVALKSKGPVVVTDLGKKWLEKEISDEEFFTKFFLKWQYPNEIELGYQGFNIKPFVATLALINKVNLLWADLGNKPVGLSKIEYALFVPSLTKPDDIESFSRRIVEFRRNKESRSGQEKRKYVSSYVESRALEIFGNVSNLETKVNNLQDYTDSSVRYFRMSGMLSVRGGGTHIDISQDKIVEVESILQSISIAAEEFNNESEYFEYLVNFNLPELPWENENDLLPI